jgi:hypothetical protein
MTEVVLEKVRQNVGYRERDSSVPGIIRWASRFLFALQQGFVAVSGDHKGGDARRPTCSLEVQSLPQGSPCSALGRMHES